MTRRKTTTQNHIQDLLINSEHVTPHVRQASFCFLSTRSIRDVTQGGIVTVINDLIVAITVPTTLVVLHLLATNCYTSRERWWYRCHL